MQAGIKQNRLRRRPPAFCNPRTDRDFYAKTQEEL